MTERANKVGTGADLTRGVKSFADQMEVEPWVIGQLLLVSLWDPQRWGLHPIIDLKHIAQVIQNIGAAAPPLDLDALHALTRFVRPESYAGDGAMLAAAVGRTAVREGWFMVAQHLGIFRKWRVRPLQPWSRLHEFSDYYEFLFDAVELLVEHGSKHPAAKEIDLNMMHRVAHDTCAALLQHDDLPALLMRLDAWTNLVSRVPCDPTDDLPCMTKALATRLMQDLLSPLDSEQAVLWSICVPGDERLQAYGRLRALASQFYADALADQAKSDGDT